MNGRALFGRYWPASSPVHRLDPRTKVLGVIVLIVIIFTTQDLVGLGLIAVFLGGVIGLAHIPFPQALRSIAPLSFVIVLTALFNVFFVQGGDVYVDQGWFQISEAGLWQAVFVSIRLFLLLLIGSLLTLTTTSMDLTGAIEKLTAPLGKVGLPTHEFAFVMGTALRFLPQFADEFQHIRKAQIARGAKLSTSPFRSGLSSLTSLIVPLFASVFRHADTFSDALEARCYHGAQGRTSLHPLAFGYRDGVAACALVLLFVLVILCGWLV